MIEYDKRKNKPRKIRKIFDLIYILNDILLSSLIDIYIHLVLKSCSFLEERIKLL